MTGKKRQPGAGFLIPLLLMLAAAGGCLSVSVRTDGSPPGVRTTGLVRANLSCTGIRHFDGDIVRLGLLDSRNPPTDLVYAEVWPLLEAGVGLVGMRLKILPLEAGVGIFGYDPGPRGIPAKLGSEEPCSCGQTRPETPAAALAGEEEP